MFPRFSRVKFQHFEFDMYVWPRLTVVAPGLCSRKKIYSSWWWGIFRVHPTPFFPFLPCRHSRNFSFPQLLLPERHDALIIIALLDRISLVVPPSWTTRAQPTKRLRFFFARAGQRRGVGWLKSNPPRKSKESTRRRRWIFNRGRLK